LPNVLFIASAPLYPVEIGYIDRPERMKGQEPGYHIQRLACLGEQGYNWSVIPAQSFAGPHNGASLQVDSRYDLNHLPRETLFPAARIRRVMGTVIGWDVGGAHLKAARAEEETITRAVQVASPLWLGAGELKRAYAEAEAAVGSAPINAITMTGELCDLFASREEGVARLAAVMASLLAPRRVVFYTARSGFVDKSDILRHAAVIASANWHASAALVAGRTGNALFADAGSTTTDIIPVAQGKLANLGFTDAERLASGELVYTGIARTCLTAGPKLVPFGGRWTPLMNEWFATMADVHRILGQLPESADMMEAADGREKTAPASCARLARMVGRDSAEADEAAWRRLAQFFAESQLRELWDAAALILSRGLLPSDAPVIGAGVGRGIIRELASRLRRPYLGFDELIASAPEARSKACDCAPASALALLAAAQFAA
jgi:(4-(4-[2-(gamma-L-glutamylamino)ethyl]phenoxymethyl)furan-2-yl)methanamine synthase